MKNVTTYTNEEVVKALLEYHYKRAGVAFPKEQFKVRPNLYLLTDGSWVIETEELPKPVKEKKVLTFGTAWGWVARCVLRIG